jgi:hypothetical protein
MFGPVFALSLWLYALNKDMTMEYVMNTTGFNQTVFTQDQIDYLTSLHFINRIDTQLKIVSSIDIVGAAGHTPPRVILELEIYYNNLKVDTLSFDLHDYEYEEIVHLAKNIRDNEFLLHEVDNFLSGDIAE